MIPSAPPIPAEKAASVQHHVALSVVGTERLADKGYFHAKRVQERLIQDSSIAYTIVHATQFFEFVKSIAALATDGWVYALALAGQLAFYGLALYGAALDRRERTASATTEVNREAA